MFKCVSLNVNENNKEVEMLDVNPASISSTFAKQPQGAKWGPKKMKKWKRWMKAPFTFKPYNTRDGHNTLVKTKLEDMNIMVLLTLSNKQLVFVEAKEYCQLHQNDELWKLQTHLTPSTSTITTDKTSMATQPHYKTPCSTITSLATIVNDQGGIGNNEVPLIVNF